MNEIKPEPRKQGYQRLDFPKNTVLLQEGDPGEFAYLIIKGRVIDRIKGAPIRPVKLIVVAEVIEDNKVKINATVRIETLIEKFRKGINTVEISYGEGDHRNATEVIINIQI